MRETVTYPHLDWFSKEHGISAEALIRIYTIEKAFHNSILVTDCAEERARQYEQLYTEVHRIKHEGEIGEPLEGTVDQHARLVRTFRRELKGRSVLGIGLCPRVHRDRMRSGG